MDLIAQGQSVHFPVYAESFAPDSLVLRDQGTPIADTLGATAWHPVVQAPPDLKLRGMRSWHYAPLRYPQRGDVSLEVAGKRVFPVTSKRSGRGELIWIYIRDDHFHPDGIYVASPKRFTEPGSSLLIVARYEVDLSALTKHELHLQARDILDFARRDVTIGDETRPGYYVPGQSRIEFPKITPSDDSELVVGVGVIPYENSSSPVEFRVSFTEPGQEERTLASRSVTPTISPGWMRGSTVDHPWEDLRIPLESLGDRTGTLAFETRVAANPDEVDDLRSVRAAWGHPIIRTASDRSNPRKNLVIVNFDTLRRDHLGCYGYERETTPVIDSLAATGIRVERAIHASSWTRPSVASLFASDHPRDLGILSEDHRHRLAGEFTTLAEVFARAGWLTGAIVANAHLKPVFGLHQGFHQHRYAMQHADELTDQAIEWVATNDDAPFFLYLHYIDPHSPYRAHEDYDFLPDYSGRVFGDPQEVFRRPGLPTGRITSRRTNTQTRITPVETTRLSDKELAKMTALYDGEIAFADYHFGRFLSELRQRGLDETTAIVVTADHGEEFREHGGYYHGYTLYADQVRSPLVMSLPGVAPDILLGVIEMIDVAPTMADLFDLDPPTGWDGVSFAPRIGTPTDPEPGGKAAVSETHFRGVRKIARESGQRKVIFDAAKGSWEYFTITENGAEEAAAPSAHFHDDTRALEAWMERHQVYTENQDTGPSNPDSETIEALRSLGYLD